MASTLTITQAAAVLNSLVNAAQGTSITDPTTDISTLLSIGQKTLLTDTDSVTGALSQVLSRTIFSIRPYGRKFRGLEADNMRFGNIVRKVNYYDKPLQNNDYIPLTEGGTVDQYIINKPAVGQENFYGQTTFEKQVTIYDTQLDVAFRSIDEFAQFVSGVYQNASDQIEQAHETMARAALTNMILGTVANNNDAKGQKRVVHLISDFAAVTNWEIEDPTYDDILAEGKLEAFAKYLKAKVSEISRMMTERSIYFHVSPATPDADVPSANTSLMRHTPYNRQKIYLNTGIVEQISANALSSIFHDDLVRLTDYEAVNFWQTMDSPTYVEGKAVYLAGDGTLSNPTEVNAKVFGIIFDEDALGWTIVNHRVRTSPYNARGEYRNVFFKFNDRYWNSFTENHVVLLLD